MVAEVSAEPNTVDWNGFLVVLNGDRRSTLSRVAKDRDLFAVLPVDRVPNWCPPFNIRRSFVIDELAVWFCNDCFVGKDFHWQPAKIQIAIQVCWQSKLAIKGSELSAVMMAHGMPAPRQDDFERLFDFGSSAVIGAVGRKPVKKWRERHGMRDEFAAAMHLWAK